ncbi:MAG: hypothetical protein R3C68_03095 [Myxococcota bacterium]
MVATYAMRDAYQARDLVRPMLAEISRIRVNNPPGAFYISLT